MPQTITLAVPGNFGNIVGAGADGVLVGALTPTALTKLLLSSHAQPALCITDDGGLYVQETTDFGDADANDVPLLPAVPAVDDATYFGHATATFPQLDVLVGTAGDGVWTIEWQYWDGAAWAALANVTDGTTAFTAAAGVRSVTFDEPTDWEKCTVDSVLGYWIRANVTVYTSVVTQPLATSGNIVASTTSPVYVDDTTDANDADTGDVDLLPLIPAVGDAIYIGHTVKFCKVKAVISQARTGTATVTLEYWNGTAWAAVTTFDDDTVGWSAAAGTYFIHFVPPSDWAANTTGNGPNAQAGFFVRMRLSALTSVTQQPLATQLWILPLTAGTGVVVPFSTGINKIAGNALTASAANADSVFLLINKTTGNFVAFTWTKAVGHVAATVSLSVSSNNELVLAQVTEDGTTEFANGNVFLNAV